MGDKIPDSEVEEDPFYNSDDEFYNDNEGYFFWNVEHDVYKQ